MKYELQNLIQGKSGNSETNFIHQIAGYLRASKETSSANEGKEYTKRQEEECLIEHIRQGSLWYTGVISEHTRIGEGAEQKVYYDPEKGRVIKLNDSIFYILWLDYFNNLIIHNYFFPDTAYSFLGFRVIDDVIFAVVEQVHVVKTEDIDLNTVKKFLKENGFENTRRNDYFNQELGIILEDLHDENVISCNKIPFFVDTVFYLSDTFYSPVK
jgi:hypothetical protein